jgi:hypothetical protein
MVNLRRFRVILCGIDPGKRFLSPCGGFLRVRCPVTPPSGQADFDMVLLQSSPRQMVENYLKNSTQTINSIGSMIGRVNFPM